MTILSSSKISEKHFVVDLSINDPQWLSIQTKQRWQREIKILIIKLCELHLPWLKRGEINIILTNDQEIKKLNVLYRFQNKATNVLSFGYQNKPLVENNVDPLIPVLFGDIILSFETLNRETLEQQKDFKHHLYHMLTHGWLHLLGYDHENDDDAKIMESLEISLLQHLEIKNPYL